MLNVAMKSEAGNHQLSSLIRGFRRLLSPKTQETSKAKHIRPSSSSRTLTSIADARRGEFERVFLLLDENGDGKISPAELQSCVNMVPGQMLSEEEAEELVVSVDVDGDGLLGMQEFMRLVEVEEEEERVNDLKEAFKAYDMEGKGRITAKSLRLVLRRLLGEARTMEECEVMIERFDIDGDGVISFDEFRTMLL